MIDRDRLEELIGEAYEIGRAHGRNVHANMAGESSERVDDGWGPIVDQVLALFEELRPTDDDIAGFRKIVHAAVPPANYIWLAKMLGQLEAERAVSKALAAQLACVAGDSAGDTAACAKETTGA